MNINSQIIINNNPLLKRYLRENSYYYKYLNRNPKIINQLMKEMQKKYKLTFTDRLDKVKDNLNMINNFMDILS